MQMATSKAKGKLKKRVGRPAKMKTANKETHESEASDLSQLRRPIDIGTSSLRQITQLFEKGTDEVREILTYECDVIYECRSCRSLFRSLANLISHKRVYCPEKHGLKPRKYSTDFMDSVCSTKEALSLGRRRNIGENCLEGVEHFLQSFYKNNNNNNNNNNNININGNSSSNSNGSSSNSSNSSSSSNINEKILVDVDCMGSSNDRLLRGKAARKATKRDLTSVVDMLTRKQNDDVYEEKESACPLRISTDNEQVLLEMMDSNQAAYQTVLAPETSTFRDLMKTQTAELKNIWNRSIPILGPDGKLHEIRSSVTSYGSYDENDDMDFVPNSTSDEDLTCATCNEKFATIKTLKLHVQCEHALHRIVFPCPCCSSVLTNRWNIYRHLFKVHRKSNEQVRRLRSQIQSRVLRIDASSMEGASKSKDSPRQRTTEEMEESMEGSELDRELQRCGACGKRFERRTALVAHSQICKERASGGARGEFSRRRKRPNVKNPTEREGNAIKLPDGDGSVVGDRESVPGDISFEGSSQSFEMKTWAVAERPEQRKDAAEIAIRVEDVSSLSKDAWDMIENDSVPAIVSQSARNGGGDGASLTATAVQPESCATFVSKTSKSMDSLALEKSDVPEVIYTSIDNSRPVTLSVLDTEQKLGIQYRGIRLPTVTLEKINVPSHRPEPALSSIASASGTGLDGEPSSALPNLRRAQCLPCNRKFGSILNLQRHNAVHQKRSRYRCRLCDFEAFLKCECIAHCNRKHNARNNRQILSELILEMPVGNSSGSSDATDSGKHRANGGTEKKREDEPPAGVASELALSAVAPVELPRDEHSPSLGGENGHRATDVAPAKAKPRRGRPPKSRGTKRRMGKKRIGGLRRARHVSPPTLREEEEEEKEDLLSKSVDIGSVANSSESIDQRSSEKSGGVIARSRAPSRMECDPELRKMVMEVIFGSAENQTAAESCGDGSRENKEASAEELKLEELDSKPLDHRLTNRELSRLKGAQERANERRESAEIQKREDDRKGSSKNARDELKLAIFQKEASIPHIPLILARKMSAKNRPVKLQTGGDVQCDATPSDGVQHDFALSLTRETSLSVVYEHDYRKSIDA